MSRCLTARAIDHVVLERGQIANSWRTERWESLRLLTPNWQSRLPGFGYDGDDPDGFRTVPEVVDFIDRYARAVAAPVETNTRVTAVRPGGIGYRVVTDRGDWRCRAVVLASGACNVAHVPPVAAATPPGVENFTPLTWRTPENLPEGGVLVVGASATGIQLADAIHSPTRPVTLAVGEHVRMPRVYRGRDILWWMDAAGVFDERYDEVDDINRARGVPSPQLVGTDERRTLDLNVLSSRGVRMVGRLAAIRDGKALFSGGLRNNCKLADLKMNRLLNTLDEWAEETGFEDTAQSRNRFAATEVTESPPLTLDLGGGEIRSIIWATGFRADFSWLEVPVLDRKGRIRHDGGVTAAEGLYVMGLQFLRRRKSALIDGAGDDARDLSAHLAAWLGGTVARVA